MSQQASTLMEPKALSLDQLIGYNGPNETFLVDLLASQCHAVGATSAALVRYQGGDNPAEIAATYPPAETEEQAPPWLNLAVQAMGQAAQSPDGLVVGVQRPDALYAEGQQDFLILMPLRQKKTFTGVAAFHLPPGIDPRQAKHRLEFTAALINIFELRQALDQRGNDLRLLTVAMRLMDAVHEHEKFKASALALVNTIATRYQAERVSLGMLEGRYIKVQAISQTEHFTRKMKLVQDIESAMEECADQNVELVHPAAPDVPTITRQTKKLADTHGPTTILSLPLRIHADEPKVIGVVTIEMPADAAPNLRTIETLRIACNLVATRLHEQHERDLWFGAKFVKKTHDFAHSLIKVEHTWLKLTAICIFVFLACVTLIQGTYKVSAPFTVEATARTILPAPFDGHLDTLKVKPNDTVVAGETVLATLRTTQLREQLLEAQAEKARYQAGLDQAVEEGKLADQRAAQAQIEETDARIRQLRLQINEASIVSPISGVVIEGDLIRRVGGTVQRGEELFQVASLANLRGELLVPESRIGDVHIGQTGELATSDRPGRKIGFEVLSIDPVAEPTEGDNVFRVRVRLDRDANDPEALLIGQEGTAKVHVDERPLVVIWTRDLVNWVRMKLWI